MRSSIIFGSASAVATMAPMLGRVGPMSGRNIAVYALVVALIAGLLALRSHSSPRRRVVVFLTSSFVLLVAIVAAASSDQIQYLASASHWVNAPAEYYESKLLVVLLSTVPVLTLITMAAFIDSDKRVGYAKGGLFGFVLVGAIAALRLASDWQHILTDDLGVAWAYLSNVERGYSLVGHSAIYAAAAVATLAFINESKLRQIIVALSCALLLTCIFLINQRADVVFVAAAIVGIGLWGIVFNVRRRQKAFVLPVSTLAATAMIMLTINPANVTYWSEFAEGLEATSLTTRVNAATEALSDRTSSEEVTATPPQNKAPEPTAAPSAVPMVSPSGLGSFALIDPILLYPHNILVELWAEVGAIGLAAFAILLIGGAFYALNAKPVEVAQVALASGGVLLVLLLHSMKAGDLSSLGVLIFSVWLVWSLPKRRPYTDSR